MDKASQVLGALFWSLNEGCVQTMPADMYIKIYRLAGYEAQEMAISGGASVAWQVACADFKTRVRIGLQVWAVASRVWVTLARVPHVDLTGRQKAAPWISKHARLHARSYAAQLSWFGKFYLVSLGGWLTSIPADVG